MWTLAIPVIFIGLFFFYQYVLLPKLNAKNEENITKASDDFARQIVGKEADIKKQFINENEHIKPISYQVNDNQIEGIISCQEKRETKDFLRQQTINAAGKALGKLTGVGVKEVDNTEFYFLVLTSTHLHYLHYADNGDCKEHLSFERKNLYNIKVGKITSEDMLKNNAFAGETERLSFESNDISYKFFFYDKLYAHPAAKSSSLDDIAKINHLFAKPFLTFTKQYRIN